VIVTSSSRHPHRRLAAVAALAVLMALVGWVLLRTLDAARAPQPAPAVRYTLLDGRQAGLTDLRGKVVLVNFWATTCAICIREMPQLVATHQRYASQGLETLAVAMAYDPPASVAQYAESRHLPFAVVIDNTGALARAFDEVKATPTSLLIDRRGRIVQRVVGAPDFGQLHRRIEALLAEPGALPG
jgi:peroxiredoxin